MQDVQQPSPETPKNDVPQGFAKAFGRIFAIVLILMGIAALAYGLISANDESNSEPVTNQSVPSKDSPAFVPAAPAGYGGTKFH